MCGARIPCLACGLFGGRRRSRPLWLSAPGEREGQRTTPGYVHPTLPDGGCFTTAPAPEPSRFSRCIPTSEFHLRNRRDFDLATSSPTCGADPDRVAYRPSLSVLRRPESGDDTAPQAPEIQERSTRASGYRTCVVRADGRCIDVLNDRHGIRIKQMRRARQPGASWIPPRSSSGIAPGATLTLTTRRSGRPRRDRSRCLGRSLPPTRERLRAAARD